MKAHIIISLLVLTLGTLYFTQFLKQQDPEMLRYVQWMRKHGKTYSGEEFNYRYGIYKYNLDLINKHNEEAAQGKHKYTLEDNKFASLTDEQYRLLHAVKFDRSVSATTHCNSSIEDTPNPNNTIDWSQRATTPVSDEGSCSSSWAFAATGALEGLYARDKLILLKLSSQQLLDCTQDYGNEGCNGGLMDQSIWYVIDNGITSDSQYSYTGNISKCQYKTSMQVYKVKDCAEVPSENYSKLISAINQQPVAVAVATTGFKLYKEGIFDGNCGEDIDAGMLLIGYGSQDDSLFWNLKTSNGLDWGINGTILISRTEEDGPGKCGIQLLATVPTGSV